MSEVFKLCVAAPRDVGKRLEPETKTNKISTTKTNTKFIYF